MVLQIAHARREGSDVAKALHLRATRMWKSQCANLQPNQGVPRGFAPGRVDLCHSIGWVALLRLALARCSEQTRRKTATQSYGATAVARRHVRRAASDPISGRHGGPVRFHSSGEACMTVTKKLVLAALGIAVFVSCEKVVAPGSISQFALAPNSVTLQANQVQEFTAVGFTSTGDSANIAVTWIATGGSVNATDVGMRHYGHYHSADCGVFHVVATTHPGDLTDSATVTVAGCNVSVASVAVSPSTATVSVNQSVHLSATPKGANGNALLGRAIAWSSSNTSVAVADVNGNVTALAPGSATITATSEGQSGTATITVTDVAVASVAVSPASASVAAGNTVQLSATPKDANGNTLSGRVVTWSSSNT